MDEIGAAQSYKDQGCLKWASFRAISGNCADHGELQGLAAAPAGALPRLPARKGLGRVAGGPGLIAGYAAIHQGALGFGGNKFRCGRYASQIVIAANESLLGLIRYNASDLAVMASSCWQYLPWMGWPVRRYVKYWRQ
jgi:hypothetical protein